MQVDSQLFDGDSSNEEEKSRISVMKATQPFKHARGLGDSWSNSIRAAEDTKIPMAHAYKQASTKNKIKAKSEQPQQQSTRKRRSVVRQETPSPPTTANRRIAPRSKRKGRLAFARSKRANVFACVESTLCFQP